MALGLGAISDDWLRLPCVAYKPKAASFRRSRNTAPKQFSISASESVKVDATQCHAEQLCVCCLSFLLEMREDLYAIVELERPQIPPVRRDRPGKEGGQCTVHHFEICNWRGFILGFSNLSPSSCLMCLNSRIRFGTLFDELVSTVHYVP